MPYWAVDADHQIKLSKARPKGAVAWVRERCHGGRCIYESSWRGVIDPAEASTLVDRRRAAARILRRHLLSSRVLPQVPTVILRSNGSPEQFFSPGAAIEAMKPRFVPVAGPDDELVDGVWHTREWYGAKGSILVPKPAITESWWVVSVPGRGIIIYDRFAAPDALYRPPNEREPWLRSAIKVQSAGGLYRAIMDLGYRALTTIHDKDDS